MFSASAAPLPPVTPPSDSLRAGPSSRPLETALRRAGLMDRDASMKDTSGPGKKDKSSIRGKPHKASRQLDQFKDSGSSRNLNLLAGRIGPAAAAVRSSATSTNRFTPLLRPRRIASERMSSVTDGDVAPGKSRVVEQWREFVKSRYNPHTRFLNLDNMADDPFLKKHHLTPPGMYNPGIRESAVIYKLASQLEPPLLSLSLANNQMSTPETIKSIPRYLPNLENLSLLNNRFRLFGHLAYMCGGKRSKMHRLKELILIGNPVREEAIVQAQGDTTTYRSEILRLFPTLSMLDNLPVAKIGFGIQELNPTFSAPIMGASSPLSFPTPMCPGVMVEGLGLFIAEFLTKFFTLFDNARTELLPAYAPSSTFSLSVNTSIPPRARVEGFQQSMPHQKNLEWASWLDAGSRNLNRLGKLERAMETLYTNPADIIQCISKFPRTNHSIAEQDRFMVDSWTVNQQLQGQASGEVVLFITIHGQFAEEPSMGIRSFDRSFVLAPCIEGSPAQLAGWPAMILSDQLVIRAYSSHEIWTPGPMKTQAEARQFSTAAKPSSQPQHNPILDGIPEPQRSLVVQLSARTRLNTSFAIQCLEGNGWDMDRAIANFEALKSSIPAEGFQ